MKKLLFLFVSFATISIVSCNNCGKTEVTSTTDSTAVDSAVVDTVAVDSTIVEGCNQ